MGKLNSIENATIARIMVIDLMNAKKNLSLKENVTNVRYGQKSSECKTKILNLA